MAIRTVGVKLMADVSAYMSGMNRAAAATKSLAGEIDKAAKGGHLDRAANGAGVLGIGLLGAAGAAVKMRADFDKAMSGVSAATHASAGEIDQLRSAAIEAGKSSSYSATEAAGAITELSKAGVSTADVLGGGLKGALSLAAAGQIDVGEAAETAASAMTQFKLSGKDIPHIADLLAAGAGKAQGSVHDMGAALNQSGLVASQFGLSIEDTTGTLAAFASAGLTGSDAGTSFKTMLLALANPAGKTKDAMDDLGISAYDASGKFVGITNLAEQLKTKLGGLTQAQRDQTLAQIFGSDAIRAANVLYQQGGKGIQDWIGKVNDAGYAGKTAGELTNNLAGDIERLKGSLETLAIEAGGGASGGLRVLAKSANLAVDGFSELPHWVQESATVLSAVGGASLLAGAGFIKVRGTARDFMDELRDMGPMGARTATGLSKISGYATKFGLIGTAIGGAYAGLELFSNWAEKRTGPAKANIDALTESIETFAATGKATGELASKYGNSLQKIGQDVDAVTKGIADLKQMQDLWAQGLSDPSLGENWDPVDPAAVQRIKDLDTTLTGLVKNGGANQAKIMLDRLAGSGKITAGQFQVLMQQLPQYAAATSSAATASTGLAKGFGDAGANAQTMTSSLDSAIGAGQKLTDVWMQLNGAVLSTDKASLAAARAIDEVRDSFKDNKKAIDGNSEAALKNRVAIGEAAKAAAEAAQAKYEETGSVDKATRKYNEYLGQLRKTLTQSGLTKKQVDALIGSYGRMPDSVTTKVSITGDKAVGQRLDRLAELQAALKAGKNISTANAMSKKGFGYADGGWTGPGSKWEPAGIVHADEYVVNKQARGSLEQQKPGALDYMNTTGQWPAYARGGLVAWPYPVNASKSRVPSIAEVTAVVTPPVPKGATDDWIIRTVHSHFPGLSVLSAYRPGAHTLSGNLSYHAMHRAVDWPASRALAEWWNDHYMRQTKELITPWNSLNIHNGQRHAYSGDVYAQHAGTGRFKGNAHDHIAMAAGGTITEPVFGIGASGRTYSFGEGGRSERVIPNWQTAGSAGGGGGGSVVSIGDINVSAPVGSHPREIGAAVVNAIGDYLQGGGELRMPNGRVVLSGRRPPTGV